MKFPEHRVSIEAVMPLSDSVLSWLDHQLEVRGIDSVIYTRYVINLLQQDAADIDCADREEFWDRKVDVKKTKDRKDGKKKAVSEGERQKHAAVECLLSVSDENDDIERLVEELCGKLKESKINQGYFSPLSINTKNEPKFIAEKIQDPAERYYAAFPALPGDSPPAQLSPSSEDNFWCKNRKTGSLAGETWESKEGSPRCASPDGRDEKRDTADAGSFRKKSAARSKSLSNSPAGTEKRKRSGKNCTGQRVAPNGGWKKKTNRDKREGEMTNEDGSGLSWSPSGHSNEIKKRHESTADIRVEETDQEKYCSMVERMLKEMLLTGNKHVQAAADEIPMLAYFPNAYFTEVFDDNYFSEWFKDSQEFIENDDWYTQPLERIFCKPVSQTKRLYKRHSYPPSMLNFSEQMDWSNLMSEKMVCLTKNTQEYILLGNVFNADGRDDVFNEELPEGEEGVLESEETEGRKNDAPKEQRSHNVANEETDLLEDATEDVADVVQIDVLEQTELERDISLKLEELTEEDSEENIDKEEEVLIAPTLEDEPSRDDTPSWFYDELPFASPNVMFNFNQHCFVGSAQEMEDKSTVDPNTSALFFNFPPCPVQTTESDCLFLASETSSTVSSVEKGYFSDVTETSYLLDTSRRSSPFPDMLLLMNYGEEDCMGNIPSTASSLKGSRLESLFESSRQKDENVGEIFIAPQSDLELKIDVANKNLLTYSSEEDEFILYSTKNMFPNGTISKEDTLEPVVKSQRNLESEIQANALTVLVGPEDFQPKLSDSTSEDERDESACFPSDLFNSFSSVGEGSGSSVLLPETRLVDHTYVLDWLDAGQVELQDEYSNSLFVHLSPLSGSEGSCWQSKILLPDYGATVAFGSLEPQSDFPWDSVLGRTRQQIWDSEIGRSPYDISPTKKGDLWQLWDVNCQKRMHEERANDSNIWNSILNLSIYSPCKSVDPTDFPDGDEVFLAEVIGEEDAVLGIQFLEEINGFEYKGPRYERSVSESDLRNMANTSFLCTVDMSEHNHDINYQLVPSENSAFQGVVPKKLHHVRSAPNLQYRSLMVFSFEDDDLGPAVAHAPSPTEHLYFSAKTHFRPIQTPVAVVSEESEYHPPDLFGGLLQNTGTPYQHYLNPGEEESNFRPKFKLQKDFDKYIQTGRSLEETEIGFARFRQLRGVVADSQTEFIEEVVVGFVLEDNTKLIDSEDGEDQSSNGNSTICNDDVGIPVEESTKEGTIFQFSDNVSQPCATGRENHENFKDTHVDLGEQNIAGDSKWDGQKIKEMNLSDHVKDYHDIWSSGYDLDLHLFRVENDGLFFTHTVGDDLCETKVLKCDDEVGLAEPELSDQVELYSCYLDVYPEVDSYALGALAEEVPEQHNCDASGLVPIPHQAIYSSDLERQWLDNQAFSGKHAKKRSLKTRRDSGRLKPCSFFLEGNCKRFDCKFSHDLSHITCRFWEEGLCFKGPLCPFFHGYPSDYEGCYGKTGDKFEYKKDEFPELDNRGKHLMKDSYSQKISRKRQIHKEFLKKTLSTRRKNRPSAK